MLVLFVDIAIMTSETLDGPRHGGTDLTSTTCSTTVRTIPSRVIHSDLLCRVRGKVAERTESNPALEVNFYVGESTGGNRCCPQTCRRRD